MAAITQPRGANPYPIPAGFVLPDLSGPNTLTPTQVAAFFRTIPGTDVRAAVMQAILSYATLGQALDAMLLAISNAWVGFDTSPPLPVVDHLIIPDSVPAGTTAINPTTGAKVVPPVLHPGGGGGGGGGGQGGARPVLK